MCKKISPNLRIQAALKTTVQTFFSSSLHHMVISGTAAVPTFCFQGAANQKKMVQSCDYLACPASGAKNVPSHTAQYFIYLFIYQSLSLKGGGGRLILILITVCFS